MNRWMSFCETELALNKVSSPALLHCHFLFTYIYFIYLYIKCNPVLSVYHVCRRLMVELKLIFFNWLFWGQPRWQRHTKPWRPLPVIWLQCFWIVGPYVLHLSPQGLRSELKYSRCISQICCSSRSSWRPLRKPSPRVSGYSESLNIHPFPHV